MGEIELSRSLILRHYFYFMIALLLVFQALLTATDGISVAPTWVTSPFVKAAQVNVIRTMTD
jgi:hypothetical protein